MRRRRHVGEPREAPAAEVGAGVLRRGGDGTAYGLVIDQLGEPAGRPEFVEEPLVGADIDHWMSMALSFRSFHSSRSAVPIGLQHLEFGDPVHSRAADIGSRSG